MGKLILSLMLVLLISINLFSKQADIYFPPHTGMLFCENNNLQLLKFNMNYVSNHFINIYSISNLSQTTQEMILYLPLKGEFIDREMHGPEFRNKKDEFNYLINYFDPHLSVLNQTNSFHYSIKKNVFDYNFAFKWDLNINPGQLIVLSNEYYQYFPESENFGIGLRIRSLWFMISRKFWKNNIKNIDLYFHTYQFHPYLHRTGNIFVTVMEYSISNNVKLSYPDNNNVLVEYHFTNELPANENFYITSKQKNLFMDETNFIQPMNNKTYFYAAVTNMCGELYYHCPKQVYRFLINSIYAVNNYYFKDKDIYNYYRQYDWYSPETNKTLLNEPDQRLIDKIHQMELKTND